MTPAGCNPVARESLGVQIPPCPWFPGRARPEVPAGDPYGMSSNGRTRAFGPRCAGSSPAPPATCGVGSRKARRLPVKQDGAGAVPVRHPTRSLGRIARRSPAKREERGQYPQGTPDQGVAQPAARLVWGEEVAGASPAALTRHGALAE